MAGATVTVTDKTFDTDVLMSDKAVLVDFWAEWCGPCRQIAPALEQIADENGDKLTVAKLNIDQNPEITTRYGVLSIPTLHVFKGGEIVKTIVGAKPKSMLLKELAEYV
ncbi:thioredoxin [Embleya sp. NPDC005575]|uniref:thioredoxin n=1 Tax=Embleya sp. NPDC005575 TaxID=3156892 RepID=UPI0033A6230C